MNRPSFTINRKTGKMSPVIHITQETMDAIQENLDEMSAIIKAVAKWDHDKRTDRLIEKFMAKRVSA